MSRPSAPRRQELGLAGARRQNLGLAGARRQDLGLAGARGQELDISGKQIKKLVHGKVGVNPYKKMPISGKTKYFCCLYFFFQGNLFAVLKVFKFNLIAPPPFIHILMHVCYQATAAALVKREQSPALSRIKSL